MKFLAAVAVAATSAQPQSFGFSCDKCLNDCVLKKLKVIKTIQQIKAMIASTEVSSDRPYMRYTCYSQCTHQGHCFEDNSDELFQDLLSYVPDDLKRLEKQIVDKLQGKDGRNLDL